MAMPVTIQPNIPSYNIEIVQKVVAETTNQITMTMVQALVIGLQEKQNFIQLSEKHIIKDLSEKITKSDEKVQRVYQKLFKATLEHIERNSPPVFQTLAAINVVTRRETAGGEYLGSFVFRATEPMITKLQAEQPGAVDDARIWE